MGLAATIDHTCRQKISVTRFSRNRLPYSLSLSLYTLLQQTQFYCKGIVVPNHRVLRFAKNWNQTVVLKSHISIFILSTRRLPTRRKFNYRALDLITCESCGNIQRRLDFSWGKKPTHAQDLMKTEQCIPDTWVIGHPWRSEIDSALKIYFIDGRSKQIFVIDVTHFSFHESSFPCYCFIFTLVPSRSFTSRRGGAWIPLSCLKDLHEIIATQKL